MTLAAPLSLPNSCVDYGSWMSSIPSCCPHCRRSFQFSISVVPCCGITPTLPSPRSPLPILHKQPTWLVQRSQQQVSPLALTLPATCNEEIRRLDDTIKVLRLSDWYYEGLDWQGAQAFLKEAVPGAFIVRESGDKNFIFSLSVQTERGPTSVRLHYEGGFFRLVCDRSISKYMPRFRCVVELVQHYSNKTSGVWVDHKGVPHSPVLLKTPLRKNPPSLAHAARLAVHKTFNAVPKIQSSPKYRFLPLPSSLLDYLGEYPYSI